MQSSILSNKCSVKLFEIVLYCILCPVTRSPKRLYSDFDIYLINFISISLSACRKFMLSTFSSILGNMCCLIYLSLYTLMLSEPNL